MARTSSRNATINAAILYGYVAAGSVLGGVARYLLSVLIQSIPGFPWATLFVNVTGSFIIGFYSSLSGPDGRLFASVRQRQFVMTGFCGGYTTFSTFSLETFTLLQGGLVQTALLHISVSFVTVFISALIGLGRACRLLSMQGSLLLR